jgi:hypothetical protein
LIENNLTEIAERNNIAHLREYQGFLFLLDRRVGIRVYNSIGNLIRTVSAPNLETFNFLGEELYYRRDNDLIFFDLYTAQTRSSKLPMPCRFALLTDERLFCFQSRSVTIFEVTTAVR